MFIRIAFLFLFALCHGTMSMAQNAISGKVTDSETGLPLEAASISIPELKQGCITDENGAFRLSGLPGGSFIVLVSYIGYQSIGQSIAIHGTVEMNFALSHSMVEANEVVVTGVSMAMERKLNPMPVTIISHEKLFESSSSNLIESLTRQPGLSSISTAGGIAKPVIRGLSYNRVIVMNDGMRQEGQQWGDEHGIEIDEYAAAKVEILRGPGSIMYGSDALAGVINVLSQDPVAEGTVSGDLFGNYQTNSGLTGYSANLTGNQGGFVWLGRVSGKMSHDYQNKFDGYVLNSKFREMSGSGYLGFNKEWGFSHINFSLYHLEPGLPEGDRDSTGAFTKTVVVNDTMTETQPADNDDFLSYHSFLPYQKVDHYKIGWMNNWYLGNAKLYFNLGYEENRRKEFEEVSDPEAYALYMHLYTVPYDVQFTFPAVADWRITAGLNGMWQQHTNLGQEFLIPDYRLLDGGLFGFASRNFERITISGGLRFDARVMNIEELLLDQNGNPVDAGAADSTSVLKFSESQPDFSALSGSAGISYRFSESVLMKVNAARGFRAPNIAELSANGRHEGTFRYETGNPDLQAEYSFQLDLGVSLNTPHASLEVSFFNNRIDNYIFSEKLLNSAGGDSLVEDDGELIPVFVFTQGDANLFGGEFFSDIHPHPLDWLHFENSFSFVNAVQKNQPDSSRYLPLIPAAKFRSELRADVRKVFESMKNIYVMVAADFYFDQNRYYAAYQTETATPGYFLLEAGIGGDVHSSKRLLFSLAITGSNLTDAAYQSHLSRLKYAPVNPASGRTGIYNMGRNFSIKLNIPLDFKT